MPSKKEAVEPALLSLISAHLEENELPKTVKKLKSEHEDELPDVEGDSLLKVFGKHGGQDGVKEKKQKKALLGLIHVFLKDAGLKSTAKKLKSEHDEELAEVEGDSLVEIYNKSKEKAAAKKSKKDKKSSKKSKKEESEEEESEEERQKKGKLENKEKELKKSKNEESEEEEEEEEAKVEESPSKKLKPGENPANRVNVPFQRIKADEVAYLKVHGGHAELERLKDNTFESKGGDVFGAKASEILSQVRGRDFTHAKNKKKRSFRSSGPVDMGSNSIKFVDSDEDE